MIDLDAYFARIGYDGPRTATLETLKALQALHPAAIPFEAIDVLLDRGIDISPAAVDAKLIAAGRGGYCYEQNGLFKRVLKALGFAVEGLVGRVLWMAPPDAPDRPRTHMTLRVTVDGEAFLCDVGFGGAVLTAPLQLAVREPQPTPHEDYRITPVGAELLVEARLGEAWAPVYQLSQEAQLEIDYELPNWFSSKHPTSHFRHNLMVARTTPEARLGLLHNRLTIRRPDGSAERRSLTADQIERTLAETFGLPVADDWRPLYARAVELGG